MNYTVSAITEARAKRYFCAAAGKPTAWFYDVDDFLY
jgi:hypothetical protein